MPIAPRARSLRRAAAAAVLVGLGAAGCGPEPAAPAVHIAQGATMGTTYTVKVVAPTFDEATRRRIDESVAAELELVDAAMSTYREDSELVRFNRRRTTEPFAVSAPTLEVVRLALEIGALTGGAFDVTVAPLVDAWGFGPPGPPAAPPTDEAIAALRRHVGFDKLEVDAAAGTIRKRDPELSCDLSAIAKGYAVDRVARALAAAGFDRYLVEVGGEVRVAGTNAEGGPWRIAIERPVAGRRAFQRVVPLADAALATSGDYRNFYTVDGVRVSHEIDPRTGRPIAHGLASVSVVDARCARADALATALLVLGPDEGPALAEREGIAALFLVRAAGEGEPRFEEIASTAFERLLAAAVE